MRWFVESTFFTTKQLSILNRVRKRKCLFFLSELVLCDGHTIDITLLDGSEGSSRNKTYPMEKPTSSDVSLWMNAIRSLSSASYHLPTSLGAVLRLSLDIDWFWNDQERNLVRYNRATNGDIRAYDHYIEVSTAHNTRHTRYQWEYSSLQRPPHLSHLASVRISIEDENHVRRHSTTGIPASPTPPIDLRAVLHSWGNDSLWRDLQLHGDGTWLIEGLIQGTIEGAADGSFMVEICPDVCSAAFMLICTVSKRKLVGTWTEWSQFAGNYRGEIFGDMALALILRAAATFLPDDSQVPPVKLWFDNSGVIHHGNKPNADGSDFVPLSIIGAAENPRCFSNHEKKLTYYNQRKAWSDTKTIKKWFADFLIHVKRRTNEPVLLIMDNCAAHNEDTFKDVSGQVRVVFLPPNCTSVYQPMDCGVIAMIKKKYRHRLLLKLLEVYNDMMTLYEQNKGRSKGTNGLDEGYPPHIRDCMDILAEITPEFTPEKIRNCWRKSTLLNKPPVAVDPVLAAVDPAPATASHTVAAATTASEGDVEMGVVDAADRVDTINESDDESGDEDILKAMTDLAELVKGQKGGDKGAPSGGSWEMSYILEELVETVEGIDVSDADARKELLNGWVSMEDTQFCKEAFADEAENDVSPEELLEGDGTYHDSDDDEAVKEAETELAAAKKMILMRLPRSFEIWRRGWRSW